MESHTRASVLRIARAVSSGDFGTLHEMHVRFVEDEIRRAMLEYGRTFVAFSEEHLGFVDFYRYDDDPGSMSVDVPLHTVEEGQSDLTLILSFTENDGLWTIEDLHVL